MFRRIVSVAILSGALSTGVWAHKGGKHGTRSRVTDGNENPYAGDASAAQAGKRLYAQYCQGCHGAKGQGVGQNPGLKTAAKQDSASRLFDIITHGVVSKGMPAWSQLPEQQRWQIVTYLQKLK